MRTIQPKIPERGKSNGTEITGDKFSKISVYMYLALALFSVPKITENAVRFKPEILVEWKAPQIL
jgi:hypothetical protein